MNEVAMAKKWYVYRAPDGRVIVDTWCPTNRVTARVHEYTTEPAALRAAAIRRDSMSPVVAVALKRTAGIVAAIAFAVGVVVAFA